MKLQKLAFILAATLGVVGTSQAAIVSGQSDSTVGFILGNAGTVSAPISGATVAGVFSNNDLQAFNHFKAFGADGNGVYSFISSVAFAPYPWIPEHKELGYWGFKGLGHSDAYFGEWAPENRSGSPSTPNGSIDYTKRTVYYIGNDSGYTPATSSITYSVQGINRYNAVSANKLLTGDLTATFGSTNKITGSLTRTSGVNVDTLTFNTVGFNASTGVISSALYGGSASATYNTIGSSTVTGGVVTGQFLGNQTAAASANAAGLVGIVDFTNRNYDTAFGGNKK